MGVEVQIIYALISFFIIIAVTIPYMYDILRGKVQPARSTRLMFLLLMTITVLQQHSLGSGYAMVVTIAELLSAMILLVLSVSYGVGGFTGTDKICYLLLFANLCVWYFTNNALLALHLSMIADAIAFWPTLTKTWHHPKSETPLFFFGGVIAPLFSILAQDSWSYSIIAFPLYLSLINLVELGLIYRSEK